jgi:LCP family protein required for cell wall assembly
MSWRCRGRSKTRGIAWRLLGGATTVLLVVVPAVATLVLLEPWLSSSFDLGPLEPIVLFLSDRAAALFKPKEEVVQVSDGGQRQNLLVLGVDRRGSETGPARTDTILVVTLDSAEHSAGTLSIPRDLWVSIPGKGEGRINTAYFWGEQEEYPGGGPGLAVAAVENLLGTSMDNYVCVDFQAFVGMVDLLGGLDICVPEPISDPTYPDGSFGYDPLYIEAGCQHFDGALALKYARTRHSERGDFDRASRQQQALEAVLEKLGQQALGPELILRAPTMWGLFRKSVETDLSVLKAVQLVNELRQVEPDRIVGEVVDETCTEFWTEPGGQEVLVPVPGCITAMQDRLLEAELPWPRRELGQ